MTVAHSARASAPQFCLRARPAFAALYDQLAGRIFGTFTDDAERSGVVVVPAANDGLPTRRSDRAPGSSACLDNAAKLIMSGCHGGLNQKWILLGASDSSKVELINENTNRCITAPPGARSVVMKVCDRADLTQQWDIIPTNTPPRSPSPCSISSRARAGSACGRAPGPTARCPLMAGCAPHHQLEREVGAELAAKPPVPVRCSLGHARGLHTSIQVHSPPPPPADERSERGASVGRPASGSIGPWVPALRCDV